jgi:nicotinamidase-related amidase
MPEHSPPCQTPAVAWTDPALPDPSRAVLVTMDMQQAFADPGSPLFAPGTELVAEQVIECVRLFAAASRPVVHVMRLYGQDRWLPEITRRDLIARHPGILAPGSPGAALIPGLLPEDADPDWLILTEARPQRLAPNVHLLAKPRWGAFLRTAMEDLLETLDADSLLICGTFFPNCVRATVYEALSRDLRVAVIPEATAGCTAERVTDLEVVGLRAVRLAELPEFLARAQDV